MSTLNSLKPLGSSQKTEAQYLFETVLPDCPFDDIALALSGGGFRAAAFSLGAISYLNHTYWSENSDTLLKHVTFLTSTSGGSITNACYSTALFKPGFNFTDFYTQTKQFMQGQNLLNRVFEIIESSDEWIEEGFKTEIKNGKEHQVKVRKSPNFINAFAKAYDEILFKGDLFGTYFNSTQNPHLKTVCFNATEFNNGMAFRFQTNGKPESVHTIGNYYLHFNNPEIAAKLKISDVVATSSCFPSGFEPLIYPNDYIHKELSNVDEMAAALDYKNNNPLKQEEIYRQPFCLMDGGIVDNQGLDSMMMEDTYRRKNNKKQFDLMMVCDVGSYFFDAFKMPGIPNKWYSKLNSHFFNILSVISLIVFGFCLYALISGFAKTLGYLFIIPSFITLFFFIYLRYEFKGLKQSLGKSSIGAIFFKNIKYFKDLKFGIIQQMASARLNSTVTMASNLFLKQIRRQYYGEFYTMPAYKNRRLSCFIYEFASKHKAMRLKNLEDEKDVFTPEIIKLLEPSSQITVFSDKASDMATTLWFDPVSGNETRDAIIACGQFTMCYNLLKYIYRRQAHQDLKQDNNLEALKIRLLSDWEKFKLKPDFMT